MYETSLVHFRTFYISVAENQLFKIKCSCLRWIYFFRQKRLLSQTNQMYFPLSIKSNILFLRYGKLCLKNIFPFLCKSKSE